MTLNIWNYTAPWPERRELIASLIRSSQPDVVALQETRHDRRYARGRGQGEQLAAMTGYVPTWGLAQVYVPIFRVDEGLTILTRRPPLRVMMCRLTRYPHQREDETQRVCLGVALEIEGSQVDVYDTHFSLSATARESNAREVGHFIQEESGSRPSIVMGDLNARPDTLPIRYLTGKGAIEGATGDFQDCWVEANGEAPGYTYASWHPYHRIDYVLARNLAGRIRAAFLVGFDRAGEVYPSDHLAVVVDIDLAGA